MWTFKRWKEFIDYKLDFPMRSFFCLSLIFTFLASVQAHSEDFRPSEHPEYYFHGGDPPRWGYQSVRERVPDPVLGFHEHPGVTIHDIMRTEKSLIWDVKLTIQENGNRLVPQKLGDRNQFIAFFGCSFVLGTGLNDDETLPFFMGKNFQSIVRIIWGLGPQARTRCWPSWEKQISVR